MKILPVSTEGQTAMMKISAVSTEGPTDLNDSLSFHGGLTCGADR